MKNIIVILLSLFFVVVGCDSGGPKQEKISDPVNETKGTVSFSINNTGSAEYPGTPDKLVLRAIGGGEKTINFPEDGNSVEVNLRSAPGSYKVGILAYNSETGEASFGAVTDTAVTISTGEIVNLDLSNRIENWKEFGIKEIRNGTWSAGDQVGLYVGGEPTSDFYNHDEWRDDFNDNDHQLFYGSNSFNNVSNAQFSHNEFYNGSFDDTEYVAYTKDLTLDKEVLNSFVGRIQVDVDNWGEAEHITRPHPSNPPQDILETVTGGMSITFMQEQP